MYTILSLAHFRLLLAAQRHGQGLPRIRLLPQPDRQTDAVRVLLAGVPDIQRDDGELDVHGVMDGAEDDSSVSGPIHLESKVCAHACLRSNDCTAESAEAGLRWGRPCSWPSWAPYLDLPL